MLLLGQLFGDTKRLIGMLDEYNNIMLNEHEPTRDEINDIQFNSLKGLIDSLSKEVKENTTITREVQKALIGNKEYQIMGLIETVIILERRVAFAEKLGEDNKREREAEKKQIKRDIYIISTTIGLIAASIKWIVTLFK